MIKILDKSLWYIKPSLTICIGIYKYQPFFFEVNKDFFGITLFWLDLRINWDKNQEIIAKWALNQTLYQLPEILEELDTKE